MATFHGKTALVTGASSGIGESLAKELARAGANLVLVARRKDRLETLANSLQQQFAINASVITCDLSEPGAAQSLYDSTQAQGIPVDVLVNNAGIGTQGDFLDAPLARHHQVINLNVIALQDLTWLYAQDMAARGSGHILLVASLAGFMPVPRFATYAATKAYVLTLGDSLAKELKSQGVTVTTLCPGGTTTEFFEHSGQRIDGLRTLAMMSSESVARAGIQGLISQRAVVVPGLLYKLSVVSLRLLPRRLQAVFGQMATE